MIPFEEIKAKADQMIQNMALTGEKQKSFRFGFYMGAFWADCTIEGDTELDKLLEEGENK